MVIIVGAFYVQADNYRPFLPYGFASFSLFGHVIVGDASLDGNGAVGVMAGAALVFFAYIGFDGVSCQAEDARRPQRDLPIAILLSLTIATVLYVAVSVVLTGMVQYQNIDVGNAACHIRNAIALHAFAAFSL